MTEYFIFNETDGVPASIDSYATKELANARIAQIRENFKKGQGYYRNNRMEKMNPDDVIYRLTEYTPTDDDFYDRYEAQYNHIELAKPERTCAPDDMCSFGGKMYETFGADMDYINQLNETEPKRIWTIIEAEDTITIVAGLHLVNRMGYLVTNEEWKHEQEDYICE